MVPSRHVSLLTRIGESRKCCSLLSLWAIGISQFDVCSKVTAKYSKCMQNNFLCLCCYCRYNVWYGKLVSWWRISKGAMRVRKDPWKCHIFDLSIERREHRSVQWPASYKFIPDSTTLDRRLSTVSCKESAVTSGHSACAQCSCSLKTDISIRSRFLCPVWCCHLPSNRCGGGSTRGQEPRATHEI